MKALGSAVEGATKKAAKSISESLTEEAKPLDPSDNFKSLKTQLFYEKVQAAREIMKMMNAEQEENMKRAKEYAKIAKQFGWPTQ